MHIKHKHTIMRNIYLTSIFLLIIYSLNAQKIEDIRINRYIDLDATIGESQGSFSGSYVHNWKLWKKRKWEAGFGIRWSSYIGSKTEFITAPARLARTNTTPF